MTTALVTRPREDAEGVSQELRQRGLDVTVAPLLDIRPVDAEVDSAGVQGILATSANGVRALARLLPDRDLPVWAVGDATARMARDAGYRKVEAAGGDVHSLAALVKSRCTPETGAFLHAAGSVVAGDLAGDLGAAGFSVRRVVLYEAHPAQVVSDELADALRSGGLGLALFFSPRTAATFVTLIRAAGLERTITAITAYALSANVARELQALPWAAVRVAAEPSQAALLAVLDQDLAVGRFDSVVSRTSMSESTKPAAETPGAEIPAPADSVTDAEIAEPDVPESEAEAVKGRSWMPVAAAVAVMMVAGAAALVWSEMRPEMDLPQSPVLPGVSHLPSPPTAAGGELAAELAATRDRLHALEARLAVPSQAPVELAPLENRLAQAETALRALQAQPQVPAKLVEEVEGLGKAVAELKRTSADAAAVLRLADRVEKVEAGFRDMQARRSSAAALLLAVGQVREAVAAALPYDGELRALKVLAGGNAEMAAPLETLKARAATGIPTLPVLTARLTAQAPTIIRAQVLPEQQGWWRQTLDRVASLVTIEREDGNAAGTSPAAILARAQAALTVGDLPAAVVEIEGLSGGPAEQAAPWLADAKARIAANKALSELTAQVVAAVGAGQ